MIHSLLSVCLLTMGVGAKASTPIELNRQQIQPTNNNTYTNNVEEIINTKGSRYVYPGTTNYGVFNWTYGTYTTNNTQLNANKIIYTNNGKLSYDPNNQNDVWMFKPELFQTENGLGSYYDRIEVISLTPNTLVYDNTITQSIKTALTTNDNISANMEYIMRVYICTNGALDQFKTYVTGDNVDGIIDTYLNQLSDITPNNYEYKEYSYKETITQNTPTTYRTESFNFNVPLVKEQNTVVLVTYQTICHNFAELNGNLLYNGIAIDSYNGLYSTVTAATKTTIMGSWSNAEVTQEVIDLPGLMWEILAMPFAFISTAFNLTLFPGTPYSLNLTNLFMTLILIMVVMFVLKRVIK